MRNNKKIALIEFTSNHYDFVIAANSFFSNIGDTKVLIRTDIESLLDFEYSNNYRGLVVPDVVRFKNYRELLKYDFGEYDEVVFLSVTFTWKLLYIFLLINKLKIPYSLVIHNVNSWILQEKFNLKKFLRNYLKKRIFFKAKSYIVLNSFIRNYFYKITGIEPFVIPFKIPILKEYIKSETDTPVIVIPGTVDPQKRDYKSILEVFSEIELNYTLVLLGRLNSQFKDTLQENDKLISFTEFVSQETFDSYMKNCDLILAPTFESYSWGSACIEKYGVSKASGAEFDCLKYKKILLINDFYSISDSLLENEVVIQFNNFETLRRRLEEFLDSKTFRTTKLEGSIHDFYNDLKEVFISNWK